ncbi:MAG: hypothetical protein ACHP9Z_28440, partial [Streptosporangiales bacterium]
MRVGIVGPMGPDYFADNLGDALERAGHSVTQLGPARPANRTRPGSRVSMLARQAMPRWDERVQAPLVRRALDAECAVVISVDAYLMPNPVRQLQRGGARVALWFPDHVG